MIQIKINNVGCVAIDAELAAELTAMGEDPHELNILRWPPGASRYSCGVFLLHSDAANALPADHSQAVTLAMLDDQSPSGGVTCDKMYPIEFRPIHIQGNSTTALYAVKLVDERYFWRGVLCDKNFNVTTTADRSAYYTATENTGPAAWTWTAMAGEIISLLGANATTYIDETAAGTPRDYLVQNERADVTMDRIATALGMVFAPCPKLNANGDRYQLQAANGTLSTVTGTLNTGTLATTTTNLGDRIGGGQSWLASSGANWLNAVMPSSVTVRFPRQIPSPADNATTSTSAPLVQFYTVQSSNGIPTGSTGRPGFTVCINDAMWALGPIGSETNAAALATRAAFVASAYYNRWQADVHNTRMRGFIDLTPCAGEVIWRHTAAGPFTDFHVRVGGATFEDEAADSLIIGLGAIQTHRTADGATIISDNGILTNSSGSSSAGLVAAICPVGTDNVISDTGGFFATAITLNGGNMLRVRAVGYSFLSSAGSITGSTHTFTVYINGVTTQASGSLLISGTPTPNNLVPWDFTINLAVDSGNASKMMSMGGISVGSDAGGNFVKNSGASAVDVTTLIPSSGSLTIGVAFANHPTGLGTSMSAYLTGIVVDKVY